MVKFEENLCLHSITVLWVGKVFQCRSSLYFCLYRKAVPTFLPPSMHVVTGLQTHLEEENSHLLESHVETTEVSTDQYQAVLFTVQMSRWSHDWVGRDI